MCLSTNEYIYEYCISQHNVINNKNDNNNTKGYFQVLFLQRAHSPIIYKKTV